MADEQKKDTVEIYEIKIQGHLDTKWSEWFYGLTITHEPDGATTLSGPPRPDRPAQRAGPASGHEPAVAIGQPNRVRWTNN